MAISKKQKKKLAVALKTLTQGLELLFKYSPSQPRDELGRFSRTGGGGGRASFSGKLGSVSITGGPLSFSGGAPSRKPMKEGEFLAQAGKVLKVKSVAELSKVAGVPDGSDVKLSVNKGEVRVSFSNKAMGISGARSIKMNAKKEVVIHNERLTMSKNAPKGISADMLIAQATSGKQAGASSIVATAGRGEGQKGYNTWARLGYDAKLSSVSLADEGMGLFRSKAKNISDLMKTKEGREYWKENGGSFKGTFSLADNSTSMKVLTNYAAKRKN